MHGEDFEGSNLGCLVRANEAFQNFEDEISLRRGECEIQFYILGHFGLFVQLMKGLEVILHAKKKKRIIVFKSPQSVEAMWIF